MIELSLCKLYSAIYFSCMLEKPLFLQIKEKKMSTKNTLKIYEKKNGYRFFFIRKDLEPLFDNLGTFSLICSDGTHYSHLEVCKTCKILRYFIYANEFFKEHPQLRKHDETVFSIDYAMRIIRISIN